MKKKILMIISLFVLLISSTACSAYDTPTEISGYFKYKINSDNNKIMIVGLTNTGKKQETLVIPSEINGKQVYRIGEPFYTFSGSNEWICNIESKKLMNLYYPSTITQTMLDDDYLYEDTPNISKIYWGRNQIVDAIKLNETTRKNCTVYVSRKNYEYNELNISNKKFPYIKVANVVYYLNDDTEDTFFVDDCDGTIVNVVPPNPIREGYKFKGWYKEKECINKWDFEKDIIPSKEYDNEGNYIFKETVIYAGWEKK